MTVSRIFKTSQRSSLLFPSKSILLNNKFKIMKRILFLAVTLTCLGTVWADNGLKLSLSTSQIQEQPPHVEFKYYGFYGIVDYTYMMNLNDNAEMSNLSKADKFSLSGVTAIAGFQWRQQAA